MKHVDFGNKAQLLLWKCLTYFFVAQTREIQVNGKQSFCFCKQYIWNNILNDKFYLHLNYFRSNIYSFFIVNLLFNNTEVTPYFTSVFLPSRMHGVSYSAFCMITKWTEGAYCLKCISFVYSREQALMVAEFYFLILFSRSSPSEEVHGDLMRRGKWSLGSLLPHTFTCFGVKIIPT